VPEEVAWRNGWISTSDVLAIAEANDPKAQNPYANYLRQLAEEGPSYSL
jgi:hypothetical protein